MIEFEKVTSTEEEVFPHVRCFIDHDSIPYELAELRKHFQSKGRVIMGKEIAFDGDCWGLYWIKGKKPSKQDIKRLLIDNGFGALAPDLEKIYK
jgi:hypothetical protein